MQTCTTSRGASSLWPMKVSAKLHDCRGRHPCPTFEADLRLQPVERGQVVQLLHVPQLGILPLQGLLNGWSQSP